MEKKTKKFGDTMNMFGKLRGQMYQDILKNIKELQPDCDMVTLQARLMCCEPYLSEAQCVKYLDLMFTAKIIKMEGGKVCLI